MKTRPVLATLVATLATSAAHADWYEIFLMDLNDGCSAPQLQAVGDKLTKKFGAEVYSVEILTNQHGATNTQVLWIGRSPDAAALANYAADIVVMKSGTAVVTQKELLEAVQKNHG